MEKLWERPVGRRWLKDLNVDGVIVGQYLGSDDQEEDLAAAHALLTAKGIQPPSLLTVMLGHANSFAYMANAAYQELMTRGPGKPIVAAPFVVNAAFSVELYLKTLHVAAVGASPREHELLELHDKLPEARRNDLSAQASCLAIEHGERPDVRFRDLLVMLNDAFVKLRYVYEEARSGTIRLQQTILVMHACRDVCARVVRPGG